MGVLGQLERRGLLQRVMDRQDALTLFMAATGVNDEGIAFCLLEDCAWNLESAVNTHLMMSDPGPPQG